MHQKRLVGLTLFVTVVAFALASYFHHAPEVPRVTINTRGLPMQGDPGAPIKIVVFEDLKCAHCARFNESFYPKIRKQYIDTGKANYTAVILSFLPGSRPVGNAAYCANEQRHFYTFVDTIFANQPDEALDWAVPSLLMPFAKKVKGMDLDRFERCIKTTKYFRRLNENYALAKQVMGGPVSTPRVYVNGLWVHPFSMARLEKIINASEGS